MSAELTVTALSSVVSVSAAPLYGEMNATASCLASATAIHLFASACASSFAYPADPMRMKSTSNCSLFSNKLYPVTNPLNPAVNAPSFSTLPAPS